MNNNEAFEKMMAEVKQGLESHNYAYIDWGVSSDFYKNCPTKKVADQVANAMKSAGYKVYVDRMGYGRRSIPVGTPVCYRIYAPGHDPNSYLDEF